MEVQFKSPYSKLLPRWLLIATAIVTALLILIKIADQLSPKIKNTETRESRSVQVKARIDTIRLHDTLRLPPIYLAGKANQQRMPAPESPCSLPLACLDSTWHSPNDTNATAPDSIVLCFDQCDRIFTLDLRLAPRKRDTTLAWVSIDSIVTVLRERQTVIEEQKSFLDVAVDYLKLVGAAAVGFVLGKVLPATR